MAVLHETNTSGLDNFLQNTPSTFNHTVIYELSDVSQFINATISILTILLNGAVAICLSQHKRKFSAVLWYQLFTLSLSDGLAGVLQSLLIITKFTALKTSTAACGGVVLVFHTAQIATILNVFQLSVKRVIVIRLAANIWIRHLRPSMSIRLGLASWILGCVFIFPVAFWLSPQPTIDGCMSASLFGTPERTLKVWTYHSLLVTTAILLLNVFYVSTICFLWARLRTVEVASIDLQTGSNPESQSTASHDTSLTSAKAQLEAFRNLCVIVVAYNITMWPYIIMTFLLLTGALVYDPDLPIFDIHILCLNSLVGPIANIISVRELRKIFAKPLTILAPN